MLNIMNHYNNINAGTFFGLTSGAAAGAMLVELFVEPCTYINRCDYSEVIKATITAGTAIFGAIAGTEAYDDAVSLAHEFATGKDLTMMGNHAPIDFPAFSS